MDKRCPECGIVEGRGHLKDCVANQASCRLVVYGTANEVLFDRIYLNALTYEQVCEVADAFGHLPPAISLPPDGDSMSHKADYDNSPLRLWRVSRWDAV